MALPNVTDDADPDPIVALPVEVNVPAFAMPFVVVTPVTTNVPPTVEFPVTAEFPVIVVPELFTTREFVPDVNVTAPVPEPEVEPEPLPQLEKVEVRLVELESRSDLKEEKKTEDADLNSVQQHEQEKAKSRLWGAFKSKESEPRILPQTESNKDTSEEKRVSMRTNEYPDLNSVSSKEPNAVMSFGLIRTTSSYSF